MEQALTSDARPILEHVVDGVVRFDHAGLLTEEDRREMIRRIHLDLLRACRERPRRCGAADERDELAPPIKKTRSHGTIAKRVGLAKRPKPAKSLPFSSSRVGRQRPVRNSFDTSSARASSVGGRVSPRAWAVFMLTTNSNLVGS